MVRPLQNKPKLFDSDSPNYKKYYEVLVPLSSFLGRTVFEKDLGFVKPAHDFQNISKAKSQNQ